MSVSNDTARVQYTLSSGAQALPVTFYFLDNAHIQALVDRDGEPLTLVENTDYTLTGAGNGAGGTLTTIAGTAADLVAGDVVTIRRNITITQLVNYVYNDSFPAETHERALDKLTMICQFLHETLARTLRFPATEPEGYDSVMPDAATRADAVLTFDNDGSPSVITKQQLIDDLSLLDPSVTIGTAGRALLALETLTTMRLLGRTTAGSGNAEQITLTAAGLAMLQAASGAAQAALIGYDVQRKVVTTQFDKTNTTLADVTDLSVTIEAGKTYLIDAEVFVAQNTTGASKIALGGTATATNVRAVVSSAAYQGYNEIQVNAFASAVEASATSPGSPPYASTYVFHVRGTITANAGGTLTVQFAQRSATGTSSVAVGSSLVVRRVA